MNDPRLDHRAKVNSVRLRGYWSTESHEAASAQDEELRRVGIPYGTSDYDEYIFVRTLLHALVTHHQGSRQQDFFEWIKQTLIQYITEHIGQRDGSHLSNMKIPMPSNPPGSIRILSHKEIRDIEEGIDPFDKPSRLNDNL